MLNVQRLAQAILENGVANCSAFRMDKHHNVKHVGPLKVQRLAQAILEIGVVECSASTMDQHHNVKEFDPLKHALSHM